MNRIEQELLETLRELERPPRQCRWPIPSPICCPSSRAFDELAGQLPPGTEPDLLHYLHRKSYQKACAFLEQRQAPQR